MYNAVLNKYNTRLNFKQDLHGPLLDLVTHSTDDEFRVLDIGPGTGNSTMDISSALRKPCLRLRILQQVLGLDTRFSRDIVHGVVCLASDIVERMAEDDDGAHRVHERSDLPQFEWSEHCTNCFLFNRSSRSSSCKSIDRNEI